jgi:arsenate reductase (thioredoxin)
MLCAWPEDDRRDRAASQGVLLRSTMSERIYNALFLCTGNSARSILAEVMLNAMGQGRFRAFSAGSHPKGEVNPFALELLLKHRMPTAGLRSKSWDEFAIPGAPRMDFVFTVCDQAAGEACPIWPGQPMTAHWGIADPAAVEGLDEARRRAFFKAYNELQHRLSIFVNLPMERLDRLTLQKRLHEIGKVGEREHSA